MSIRRAVAALSVGAGGAVAALVTVLPSYEKELGKACYDRHVAAAERMLINGNEAAHKRAARVQDRLVALEPRLAAFQFCLVQSESSRMHSLPGGYAIVHSGALDALDETALDFALAREMALSTESHGPVAKLVAAAYALVPSEAVLDLVETLRPGPAVLLRAERLALTLLAKACYDPTEMPSRLPAVEGACGGDVDAARGRAVALAADVPAALDEAAEALAALARVAPDSPDAKLALLRALRDARAGGTLVSVIDAGSQSEGPRDAALLEKGAAIFEAMAAERGYHAWLSQPQTVTCLLSVACAPAAAAAAAGCRALLALAREPSNHAAFGSAERTILADLALSASSEPAAAAAAEAIALIRDHERLARDERSQRAAQVKEMRAKIDAQLAARQAKEGHAQEVQERRRRIAEWFGPRTRKKRAAMAGIEQSAAAGAE
jgi:hypothetical protein